MRHPGDADLPGLAHRVGLVGPVGSQELVGPGGRRREGEVAGDGQTRP